MENMSYQNKSQNIYKQYTSHCRVSGSAMCTVYIEACVITGRAPPMEEFSKRRNPDLWSLYYPRNSKELSWPRAQETNHEFFFFFFFLLLISQLFLNRFSSFKRQTTLKITPESIRLF